MCEINNLCTLIGLIIKTVFSRDALILVFSNLVFGSQ